MNGIYLFTGAIKSGKTSRLEKWINENPGADGILAPVIGGKRHLVRIKTGEKKLLEYSGDDPGEKLTSICNYNFLDTVFDWGKEELYNAVLMKPRWLIVDEIGPLELKGLALEPTISRIINENKFDVNIVLVVRKMLVEKVIGHYSLLEKGFKFFEI